MHGGHDVLMMVERQFHRTERRLLKGVLIVLCIFTFTAICAMILGILLSI